MQDGLFFVAVDFAGEKLLEINVFSPGGLVPLSRAAGIDFIPTVIDALERKSDCGRARGGRSNAEVNLATG